MHSSHSTHFVKDNIHHSVLCEDKLLQLYYNTTHELRESFSV